jgi:hypothetical protein
MGTSSLESLEYRVVSGKPSPETDPALHDAVYTFWKQFWSEVYRSVGESGDLSPDDFARQDRIAVFLHEGKVVALHAYTLFDLRFRAQRECSYFARHFADVALRKLEQLGARRVMSMEYIAVSPEWRSKQLGVSLASVIVGLGLRLAETLGVDASISSARMDVGADKICDAFGSTTLAKITAHQRPTALVAFLQGRWHEHGDPEVRRWVSYFWERRRDVASPAVPTRRAA